MKKTARLSTALLSDPVRARFLGMLEVAARRSIVAWEQVEGPHADVVVCEQAGAGEVRGVQIHVGDTPPHQGSTGLWLRREFRLSALMDVLDLAAVRVLNQRDQQARVAVEPSQQSDLRYRLKHWVFLSGERAGANYMRVLAGMSRQAVSRSWIMKTGALNELQVDALLCELRLQKALLSEAPITERPGLSAKSARPSRGFVARLRRWIDGSRTAFLASAPGAR